MNFIKILKVLLLHYLLVVEAPDPILKRPLPDTSRPPPPPKHRKAEESFVSKFRDFKVEKGTKIPSDLVAPFLGHGGTYEAVQPLASKFQTIESDHAPHYSVLEYLDTDKVDTKHLPEKMRNAVETRRKLQNELQRTDYPQNEEQLKLLKKEGDTLRSKLDKVVRVSKWGKQLQKQYLSNVRKITETIKKTEVLNKRLEITPDDVSLKAKVEDNVRREKDLMEQNKRLRAEAETDLKTPEQKRLAKVEADYIDLEAKNNHLSRALRAHNDNIKNAMGVLSIPYEQHRMFPSTGSAGLNDEIRALKNADAATAKVAMEDYDKAWASNMKEGINNGHLKVPDDLPITGKVGPNGKKIYDWEKIDLRKVWEANFDSIAEMTQGDKKSGGKSKPKAPKGKGKKLALPPTPVEIKTEYMDRLYKTYAKKFMTTTIYYAKTPEAGYSRLVNLYIEDYKLHLKNDFDSYKLGVRKLLEANKDFGWITTADIEKLKNDHKLTDVSTDTSSPTGSKRANEWNEVEDLIKIKNDKSSNPIVTDNSGTSSATESKLPGAVCSTSSTRRKRSASRNACIFFSKGQHESDIDSDKRNKPNIEVDENNPNKVKPKLVGDLENPKVRPESDYGSNGKRVGVNVDASDFDEFGKPKIKLPSDVDTVSIDSKRLNTYLSQMDDGDITSARVKESIVEYASRNSDKLTGSPEEIARTKALLKKAALESHSQQNALARGALRNDGSIPPRALSKFQKVQISASKFAAKAAKFTSGSGKVSGSYGKIMLAKGVVTALRHGDYESLALMGGRIGLEFALQGVTKLGNHIAKKATTKFMTKFGSNFLGKMAGPVGAVADIGMNVYSITKSVKRLNDPNASRFDQNDAIADIVADSIDIAVTASAAVLALVFPPLAPLFGAVAFIVNVLATFVVAFYKAANHVDRLNDQIPLLTHEKTTEYFRYIGGRDTSGYIQDLIDTKRANNIAVNLTVQFLVDNPDYIGRVFPSKTIYNPEAKCALESKNCGKLFHFISLPCTEWRHLSSCDGAGRYCNGDYSSWKCQSDSATGGVVPLFAHGNVEYRCKCGSDPPPAWGYEVLNQYVDLREKKSVYLERAAPDYALTSGYEYLCKPSTLDNQGKRVSNSYTSYAYLCKGAIALKKRYSGKFMLYDLGEGTDTVYLDSNEMVDNLFIVKDGEKTFYGNGGDDTFVFSGPCNRLNGWLNGEGYRDQGNSLVLQNNCSLGNTIEINLESKLMKFRNGKTVALYHVQRVIGRTGATEVIRAGCSTRLIVGGGGRSASDPDSIILPWCSWNQLNLTISVEDSATLDATNFARGTVFTLLKYRPTFKATVPKVFDGTLLFKFENVGSLTSAHVDLHSVSMAFSNGAHGSFYFTGSSASQTRSSKACDSSRSNSSDSQISILISDGSKFNRQIIYDLENSRIQCFYSLDREARNQVGGSMNGYDPLDNVFHLKSGSWNVVGGRLNDQFILKGSDFSGSINGASGQNTLQITNDVTESLEVNFNAGFIRGRSTIYISNIGDVAFRRGFTERVITSCSTKTLDVGGTAPDHVEIPFCNVDMTIAVIGRVTIIDRKSEGTTTIQAGFGNMGDCSSTPNPNLDLSLSHPGGGEITIFLNFAIIKLSSASTQRLNIDGGNVVNLPEKFPNIYFTEGYDFNSLLAKQDGQLIAFHELSNSGASGITRKGSNAVPNVFKLDGGRNWHVFGGSLDDTFSLVRDSFDGTIDGGGGRNSFYISDDITTGSVSIKANAVWIRDTKSVSFQNIQEFHGRSRQTDSIVTGCETQYVSLSGGRNLEYPDTILIQNRNCVPKITCVAMGSTNLESASTRGNLDIYLQYDTFNELRFKADVLVTNETTINFPIQVPAHKLNLYELTIVEKDSVTDIRLHLKFSDNDNFVEFNLKYNRIDPSSQMHHVNMLFVDEGFNSNGNILVNHDTNEIIILHVLQIPIAYSTAPETARLRRGATGAKNIFRLNTGNWEAFGGTHDDSFILNDDSFQGRIHGLGGVNSLILTDSLSAQQIVIDLPNKTLTISSSPPISVNSVQTIGGRKSKQDKVLCACDTKLVMLEGGASANGQDVIEVPESFCQPSISFVVAEYTRVENKALIGNFTYHVRTSNNFEVAYNPTVEANHAFKFEISLDKVKSVEIESSTILRINFENSVKKFPINFQNLPTFTIGQGPELVADLILMEHGTPRTSIVARRPFSGRIYGVNGAENGIIVETSGRLQSIIGGDKDDNIFLSDVQVISMIDGREGTNRLQLANELLIGTSLEFDLNEGKAFFLEDDSHSFVEVLKGITLFTRRENGFETVILACDTASVKYADEIIVRRNCGYDVRIEVGPGTRVIFDIEEEFYGDLTNEVVTTEAGELTKDEQDDDDEMTSIDEEEDEEQEDDEVEEEVLQLLEPSTFYYHFSTLQSFDIEIESFPQLSKTRHIFYLNFSLSDLSSIKFSVSDSRLVYTTPAQNVIEYSHLVGDIKETSMFYSQPEFMTAEGFLLRVTRYGEIICLIANPEEELDLLKIQQEIVPRLFAYADRLGISFILETGSEFIYVGSPSEVNVLSNRENLTSHLIGFPGTTYEILNLDDDIFIYPQSILNGNSGEGAQVLDLSDIVFQIRNETGKKYIPTVTQSGDDLEIVMENWTDIFSGKVVLVSGTTYQQSISILLNSIAMEILPSAGGSENNGSRTKRSIDNEWTIKPRPIALQDGHVYLFAAEDLEDEVEIRQDTDTGEEDNSTFEYGKDENDLIITRASSEELETGKATSFIIFDYYAPSPTQAVILGESQEGNETEISPFAKMNAVNIQVNLGNEVVKVATDEKLVSESGEEIQVQFYEDILDREEAEITKDFPDIPRTFKVSWQRKIQRTAEYRYTAWAIFLGFTISVGTLIYTFCRKKTVKQKYLVEKRHMNGTVVHEKNNLLYLDEYYDENFEDYEEPRLITGIKLTEEDIM